MRKATGLKDKNGRMILEGDKVSLGGNMTADDGMGALPNGYLFDEEDVYRVFWDGTINNWSLDMGILPDSSANIHYLNHAVSLLHDESVLVVNGEEDNEGQQSRSTTGAEASASPESPFQDQSGRGDSD